MSEKHSEPTDHDAVDEAASAAFASAVTAWCRKAAQNAINGTPSQVAPKTGLFTIRDLAEQCVGLKYPRVKWRSDDERIGAIKDFCDRIREIEFRRQFPNLRYGAAEAVQRAMKASRDDLWRVLICFRIEAMGEAWVWEQYWKAYQERDWEFMKGFFWALGAKQKIRENRWDFLCWFLVNDDKLEGLTARQILDEWEQKRAELFKTGVRELPTFHGHNRELKFRQWLSRQGFKLGRKGRRKTV